MDLSKTCNNYLSNIPMEEQDYLLALSHCPLLGPSRLHGLRGHFNSWHDVWEANRADLTLSGLSSSVIETFLKYRRTFNLETIQKRLRDNHIQFVTLDNPFYPQLLRTIHLPPPLLYYQGSLEVFTKPAVAIVGTRTPTLMAQKIINVLVPTYIRDDFLIISGLARGVDTLSHHTALRNKGYTAAILPTSLDRVYPPENTRLARSITNRGCLLSEFPPGTPFSKGNFVRRNRLIAGLAETIIAIEARKQSGSLHSLKYAELYHRNIITIN